jgi:hypothetical protein
LALKEKVKVTELDRNKDMVNDSVMKKEKVKDGQGKREKE